MACDDGFEFMDFGNNASNTGNSGYFGGHDNCTVIGHTTPIWKLGSLGYQYDSDGNIPMLYGQHLVDYGVVTSLTAPERFVFYFMTHEVVVHDIQVDDE